MEHISKITLNFVEWFKTCTNKEKEFASALMIANLDDDKLERIKSLTREYSPIWANFPN